MWWINLPFCPQNTVFTGIKYILVKSKQQKCELTPEKVVPVETADSELRG